MKKKLKSNAVVKKHARIKGKFLVNTSKKIDIINGKDVLYLEGDGNCTFIYLTGKKKLAITKNLGYCCKVLPYSQCMRMGKSMAINMNHVVGYDKYSNSILFDDDTAITLKKEQIADFNELSGSCFIKL